VYFRASYGKYLTATSINLPFARVYSKNSWNLGRRYGGKDYQRESEQRTLRTLEFGRDRNAAQSGVSEKKRPLSPLQLRVFLIARFVHFHPVCFVKHRSSGYKRNIFWQLICMSVKHGVLLWENNTGCFKRSFTTLKEYINLFRGHAQCF
jgi:hypothetical protein